MLPLHALALCMPQSCRGCGAEGVGIARGAGGNADEAQGLSPPPPPCKNVRGMSIKEK